jgi:membrane-bound serine protease (ClpP class)
MTFRRLFAVALLIGGATAGALPAHAQDTGPTVDIVEVSGVIDAPIHRYVVERIDDAEARGLSLLVLQVDSLGMLKVPVGQDGRPVIIERIRGATIPVAVHIGPRGAHAGGDVVALLEAADSGSMGPSSVAQGPDGWIVAQEALEIGVIDRVVPSVADLLLELHGTTVDVAGADVVLDVPRDLTTVRFWQPGPIRRALHALAVPPFAYLLLCFGVMLLVFESSQPGFGVAGGTAILLLGGAAYAFTVLPARWYALVAFAVGNLLLWLDVLRDELKVPTWIGTILFGAGSVLLLPRGNQATTLPTWVALATTFAAFGFYGPIMTLVHRQRRPIAQTVKRRLIGEAGDVRSMLNPEGYVMVDGELWRARLQGEPARLRVGERVTVTGVDGAVLLVMGIDTSAN